MKIENKPDITEFINKLNDVNELNLSISDMLLSIINNFEIASEDELNLLAEKYNTSVKDVYLDKIIEYWDIDPEQEDNQEIISSLIYPAINEKDSKEFLENPYNQMVFKNVKNGNLALIIDHYSPYEIFAFDDISVDENYIEHSSLGFFRNEFKFLALNDKNVTWMSITPNEIKTMENSIKEAKGRVLVFGLGLGYYPYMISLKDEVSEITIVEKDEKIISIFKNNLLPQFKNKEKIKIVHDDAFNMLGKKLDYDFAFIDLWHSAEDGIELYLKCKRLEENNPSIIYSYWLERSFYAFMRRAFISLLVEQLEGYKESQYQYSKNSFDKLINHYYYKTKNLHISSVKDIEELLLDKSLLELAK